MENKTFTSPDMVKLSDVISILTSDSRYYKSEKEMASIIRQINCLKKYDLHPVSDTINNTTINIVADKAKVKELVSKIKENV